MTTSVPTHRRVDQAASAIRSRVILVAAVVVSLLTFMFWLSNAPPASAAPDICDQYPNLPQCDDGGGGGPGGGGGNGGNGGGGGPGGGGGNGGNGGGGGTGPGNGGGGPGTGSGAPGASDSSGAELPFTGYPLTPALLLVLLLLAAGGTLRLGMVLHDRYSADRPSGIDPPADAV